MCIAWLCVAFQKTALKFNPSNDELERRMKTCSKCGECKQVDCFAVVGYWKGEGERPRRNTCKTCVNSSVSKALNKGWVRDKKKAHLAALKLKCKNRNTPFNLSVEDLEIPDECPAIGIKLRQEWGGTKSGYGEDNSPSLDKLIPELGYIKGNVRVISNIANRIKSNATIDQMRGVLRYMEREIL